VFAGNNEKKKIPVEKNSYGYFCSERMDDKFKKSILIITSVHIPCELVSKFSDHFATHPKKITQM
jgi:hypothetical protein